MGRDDRHEILPGVFVGNATAARRAESDSFDRVVSVAEGLSVATTTHDHALVVDPSVLDREAEFERAVAAVREALSGDERVLVHCYEGRERAPTVLAAALAVERGRSFAEALARIEERRPIVDPTPALRRLGRRYVEAERADGA